MAKNNNLGDFLTDIANAIRIKARVSGKIEAQNFSNLILSIKTLPTKYQEVEYLESTGTQYIDTNISGNLTHRLEVKFSKNILGTTETIIGTTDSSNNRLYIAVDNINRIEFQIDSKSVLTINDFVSKNTIYDCIAYQDTNGTRHLIINGNELTASGTHTSNVSANTIKLFQRNNDRYFKGKIYQATIINSNKIILARFIPCYRKSDNVAGMYDLVNSVFYTNSGTGDFVVGPDII